MNTKQHQDVESTSRRLRRTADSLSRDGTRIAKVLHVTNKVIWTAFYDGRVLATDLDKLDEEDLVLEEGSPELTYVCHAVSSGGDEVALSFNTLNKDSRRRFTRIWNLREHSECFPTKKHHTLADLLTLWIYRPTLIIVSTKITAPYTFTHDESPR